jgi:hypothetical protein
MYEQLQMLADYGDDLYDSGYGATGGGSTSGGGAGKGWRDDAGSLLNTGAGSGPDECNV